MWPCTRFGLGACTPVFDSWCPTPILLRIRSVLKPTLQPNPVCAWCGMWIVWYLNFLLKHFDREMDLHLSCNFHFWTFWRQWIAIYLCACGSLPTNMNVVWLLNIFESVTFLDMKALVAGDHFVALWTPACIYTCTTAFYF